MALDITSLQAQLEQATDPAVVTLLSAKISAANQVEMYKMQQLNLLVNIRTSLTNLKENDPATPLYTSIVAKIAALSS